MTSSTPQPRRYKLPTIFAANIVLFLARSDADFSHGICPDCIQKHYPEYASSEEA